MSLESSYSSICYPKQTKIQKLNETRYCQNCGSEMKKWQLLTPKMFEKKIKKIESLYLALIKKLNKFNCLYKQLVYLIF